MPTDRTLETALSKFFAAWDSWRSAHPGAPSGDAFLAGWAARSEAGTTSVVPDSIEPSGFKQGAASRDAELAGLARSRIEAWAGSVRRLVAVAPIRAICEETGVIETGHSTPPERQALRGAVLRRVDDWLQRDLERLAAGPAPVPPDDEVARLRDTINFDAIPTLLVFAEGNSGVREVIRKLRAALAAQPAPEARHGD